MIGFLLLTLFPLNCALEDFYAVAIIIRVNTFVCTIIEFIEPFTYIASSAKRPCLLLRSYNVRCGGEVPGGFSMLFREISEQRQRNKTCLGDNKVWKKVGSGYVMGERWQGKILMSSQGVLIFSKVKSYSRSFHSPSLFKVSVYVCAHTLIPQQDPFPSKQNSWGEFLKKRYMPRMTQSENIRIMKFWCL